MRTWMHHPTSYFMTLVIALLGGLLTGSLVVVLVLVAALSIAWVAMRRSLNASRRGRIVWTMLAVATALAAAARARAVRSRPHQSTGYRRAGMERSGDAPWR